MKGRIHSFESCGAVDGFGIRYIVFLAGCPLRCAYCHNPDTWHGENFEMSAQEVFDKILGYKNFIKNGGVTISGGEPLLQAEFCLELISLCKTANIHTAIDTSGAVPLERCKGAISESDLILLDIKDINPEDCKALTGLDNKNAIAVLDFCESIKKPVWIRHVLIPQYTLKDEKLTQLARFLKNYKCIERIDLLPYHTLGVYKWENMGIEYRLKDINQPSEDECRHALEIVKKYSGIEKVFI